MKFKIGDIVRVKKGLFAEGIIGGIIGIHPFGDYFELHIETKHNLYVLVDGLPEKLTDGYYFHQSDLEKVKS